MILSHERKILVCFSRDPRVSEQFCAAGEKFLGCLSRRRRKFLGCFLSDLRVPGQFCVADEKILKAKTLFLKGNGCNFAPQAKKNKDKNVTSKGKWGQFCAAGEKNQKS